MVHPRNRARNQAIYERRVAGDTYRVIGQQFGLNPQYARSIYENEVRRIRQLPRVAEFRESVLELRRQGLSPHKIREALSAEREWWPSINRINQIIRENPLPHCDTCTCFAVESLDTVGDT